jgi:protein arginine N-methyltransferase 1
MSSDPRTDPRLIPSLRSLALTRETVLGRVPELSVRLHSDHAIGLEWEGGRLKCGPHGLAVLDAFAQPRSLAAGLDLLGKRAAGVLDWAYLVSTVYQMYESGILYDVSAARRPPWHGTSGYDDPAAHVRMLNDRVRTTAYLAAIRESVRPGDVVVDLGTGSGVMAVAAAQAGARHVYAIEPCAVGDVAQEVFAANGLADRITLVRGWSTQVELPEPADVLISVLVSCEPFGEGAVEYTHDALRRLVKPGARLVPESMTLWALPLSIPETARAAYSFTPGMLADWRQWYGIDFDPLAAAAGSRPRRVLVNPTAALAWAALSDPVPLANIDFRTATTSQVRYAATATATAAVLLNGILLYFELSLSPGVKLSQRPVPDKPPLFWKSPLWLLSEPLPLTVGTRLSMTYAYGRGAGDIGSEMQVSVIPADHGSTGPNDPGPPPAMTEASQ